MYFCWKDFWIIICGGLAPIYCTNKKIIVGSVYRPNTTHPTLPSSEQFLQFFDLLTNLLDDFSNLNTQVMLMGDLNLDALKYGIIKNVTEYIDLLFSYGFLQLVLKPTRCTLHSATVIDHILSNSHTDNFESFILISKLSDHFPIFYFSKCKNTVDKKTTISYRDFSNLNFNRFSDSIRAINWNRVSSIDNVHDSYNEF